MLLLRNFLKKYWPYLLITAVVIFLSVRLFSSSNATKLVKKELGELKDEKKLLQESEECLIDSLTVVQKDFKQLEKEKQILLNSYIKTINDIDNKIKEDEDKISDIDDISTDSIRRYLSGYKYSPIKRTGNRSN